MKDVKIIDLDKEGGDESNHVVYARLFEGKLSEATGWELKLDLGRVNPDEFESWASPSLQRTHKIKVKGSGKNWLITGKGDDSSKAKGSSADWIKQLLGKAWKRNKIKIKEGKLSEAKYKVGDNVILHMRDGKKVKGKIIGLKNNGRIRLKTKYKKAVGGGPGSDKFTTDKKDVKKVVIEGKITEGKESIFDVAAKVMKDQQNYNYKSKKGMVKLDMQTANLLTQVFKKVNPKMKKYLSKMGEDDPARMVQTLRAVAK